MTSPLVWSEREGGDWEACVISSYLIGLVYGGLQTFPLGIYTQAEREALEQVADEPQDYYTTDATAQARYGVQLRKLSTGSIDDAVTRVGIGLVLAGYGGLLIATTAPIHSVFYLPTSPSAGLLFDPLAANQSAGASIAASRIVAWSKGAGPNDAREVKENEFAMPMGPIQTRQYPTPRTWMTKAGVLVGRRLDPAPLTNQGTFAAGSPALASAEYTIDPPPAGWPAGPYQLVQNGALAGYLVANSDITLPDPVWPIPAPAPAPAPAGLTEADVHAIVKAAVNPLAALVADLDRRLHRFEDIQ